MWRTMAVVLLASCGTSSGGDGGSAAQGGGSAAQGGGSAAQGGGSAAQGGGTAVQDGGSCQPACAGKTCGDDGCGGSCGTCGASQQCVGGQCRCLAETDAELCASAQRTCDPLTKTDRCGVARTVDCGSCQLPLTCGGGASAGQCGCTPRCGGKTCGADGCGGTCGACPAHSTCSADQSQCTCEPGYWPDPQGTLCLATGTTTSPAQGFPPNGYCIGARYWAVPDQRRGLQVWDCGAGQCRPDGNGGASGSCTCGGAGTTLPDLGTSGFCVPQSAAPAGFADRELLFTCFAGNVFYDNCKARTGQTNGVCQTLVSSFGSQSNCYCDVCTRYEPSSSQCLPACYGTLPRCVTGTAGTYSCFAP